ncbi:putative Fasciclin-like arabinogalactan protein 20 [Hibiscus syriacus]|uniref:Fasciclin-like arabinogalactan protein 20 n=1 Tax=Hibiscus syriacus TaxID=106335 RepID=A0A6A3ARG2_HIBSY|nr:putative Fasciclin-like arabinogalactan protein 20 [Hibiscus syriacus]
MNCDKHRRQRLTSLRARRCRQHKGRVGRTLFVISSIITVGGILPTGITGCLLDLQVLLDSSSLPCGSFFGLVLLDRVYFLSVGQDGFHGEVLHTLKYVAISFQAISTDRYGGSDANFGSAGSFVVYSRPSTCHPHVSSLRTGLMLSIFHVHSSCHEMIIKEVQFRTLVWLWKNGWNIHMPRMLLATYFLVLIREQQTIHSQSKHVISCIVDVVNAYIYTFANSDPSPDHDRYYNQSGPSMPPLCSPFDSQLRNRLAKHHLHGISIRSMHHHGKDNPDRFTQLLAAVNESHALEHYKPLLLCLQNCDFVRDTFQSIASNYFHPLEHYLKIVNAGLGLILVGVLLCLVLWIFYAEHPRREKASVKRLLPIKCMTWKNICRSNTTTTLSATTNGV